MLQKCYRIVKPNFKHIKKQQKNFKTTKVLLNLRNTLRTVKLTSFGEVVWASSS